MYNMNGDFVKTQIVDVPTDFEGSYFGDLPPSPPREPSLVELFGYYDPTMSGPIEDAIAKAKADIQKQLDAAKAKAIADLTAKATTAASGIINKVTSATTQTISKGIDKVSASPTTAKIAEVVGQSTGEATLTKAEEIKQKSKPYLIGAGVILGGFLLMKILKARKIVSPL